jgi:carbon-monoxide dehydrogenase medium subunit
MRLAAPAALVDINRLTELAYVDTDEATVRVGALARHAQTERDPDAFAALGLLREATRSVAHPTIRNRGTTVGSIVHADPAAELPAVLLLCDGSVTLQARSGTRTVAAADFFLGPLEADLRTGELATSATFTVPPPRTGTAWLELSRRHGDYALCGMGVSVTLDESLRVDRARAAYISVGPTPVLVDLTDAVGGQPHDGADWAAAGALAISRVEPDDDIHATAAYRAHLAGVLTERAGRVAARRAAGEVG